MIDLDWHKAMTKSFKKPTGLELLVKWIDALRSGKYVKGKGRLRGEDDRQFCIFGVLCDLTVTGKRRWRKQHTLSGTYNWSFEYPTNGGFGRRSKMPPPSLRTFIRDMVEDQLTDIDIRHEIPANDELVRFLYEINDYTDMTFVQLADFLEDLFFKGRVDYTNRDVCMYMDRHFHRKV